MDGRKKQAPPPVTAESITAMRRRKAEVETMLGRDIAEMPGVVAAAERGDRLAMDRRKELREAIERLDDERLELESALNHSAKELEVQQRAAAVVSHQEAWANVAGALELAQAEARDFDAAIDKAGELFARIRGRLNGAHGVAVRTGLGENLAWATSPADDGLWTALVGAVLRAAKLPDDFLGNMSKGSLDSLSRYEPLSAIVAFQAQRILAHREPALPGDASVFDGEEPVSIGADASDQMARTFGPGFGKRVSRARRRASGAG